MGIAFTLNQVMWTGTREHSFLSLPVTSCHFLPAGASTMANNTTTKEQSDQADTEKTEYCTKFDKRSFYLTN